MPVEDASGWAQADKDRVVDWVFNHPHKFTLEDIEWAERCLGIDEPACRRVFKGATRLIVITLGPVPVYLIAVSPENIVSTACGDALDGRALTKDVYRFSRSEAGKAILRGTIGYIEAADLQNGSVRSKWLGLFGYRPQGLIDYAGQSFIRFTFEG